MMPEQNRSAPAPQPALLFSPLRLRGLVARNRIVVSPMCQYASLEGAPTDWHLVHLGKYAVGGAGIVFAEETAIEPRGRKTYDCAGIYDDRHVPLYRRITDFISSQGALPAIQLGHSGAKAGTRGAAQGWLPLGPEDALAGRPAWRAVSASAVSVREDLPVPVALEPDDIAAMLERWAEAARRSVDAGFEICEIHGAHGYLIHQFLSPLTNRRSDAWGGGLEGRMRFALEVAERVRAVWPQDRPLFFRLSSVDGMGGDWTIDDSVRLARALSERGVDVIDCSSGGIQGGGAFPPVPRVPGHHAEYSAEIRREAGVTTMTVGMITSPRHAERLLADGAADLIALARGLMQESEWPLRAAKELQVEDPFAVVPDEYAYRLRKLEETRGLYPRGTAVTIPMTHDRGHAYRWPEETG